MQAPQGSWLGGGPFSANSGGIASENATVECTANAGAVSVVTRIVGETNLTGFEQGLEQAKTAR